MNFAAAAKRETVEKELKCVQLTGLVVLKIVKHCNSCLPALVTGQLLGLDVGSTLEVTDCFPFPSLAADYETAAPESANYQLEMMRCLREVNVDNNTVGWYQSSNFGSFETVELLNTFINYYESIRRCVAIIYDPQKSASGTLVLKAVKLKDSFIELYKANSAPTAEVLAAQGLSWHNIFQEVPITIQNSSLVSALVTQLDPDEAMLEDDVDRLSLSTTGFLEQNMSFLGECMDDLVQEHRKVSNYHRSVLKQQQQFQQWLQQRRQENMQRKAMGEEPLPEEDLNMFKPIAEPSQIDACLITHQMSNYSERVRSFATTCLEKLYLAEGFQKAKI
ncbi:unnamed protein product [Ostreobium quekettii]|uniref:Eukaryotic translation initiation factor 3 subunit H n=1 Tax=Ostreobium quekettii TaxID=121088 RepID=A0A8S1J4J3_9CHLO|nr:unnamed protein product [Ostreobium quekettii]|eukprot:evm.model.scf_635.2 EVM.evm.TU.scf_635.2   scf_635:32570-35442(+)